jgi:hypothetical protein
MSNIISSKLDDLVNYFKYKKTLRTLNNWFMPFIGYKMDCVVDRKTLVVNTQCRIFMAKERTSFPLQFGTAGNDFYCTNSTLTNLIGSPRSVKGHFACDRNKLKDLVGGPETVGGPYWATENPLTSLEGLPKSAGVIFMSVSDDLPMLRLLKVDTGYISLRTSAMFDSMNCEISINTYLDRIKNGMSIKQAIWNCSIELEHFGLHRNAKW